MSSNKQNAIESYCASTFTWERTSMVRAMSECLDLKEKCAMLKAEFQHPTEMRDAAIRGLQNSDEIRKSKEYVDLIQYFISSLQELKGKDCRAVGFCLANLAEHSSTALQKEITSSLIKSKYISNRRRGYKLAKNKEPAAYLELIESQWERWGDFEAARIIIDEAEVDYLTKHKTRLLENCEGSPWLVARLYIALSRKSTSILTELRDADGITYAYVQTKIGGKLSEKEAFELFNKNIANDRIGLLIWCFGKQRLWKVLRSLAKEWGKFEEANTKHKLEKFAKYA